MAAELSIAALCSGKYGTVGGRPCLCEVTVHLPKHMEITMVAEESRLVVLLVARREVDMKISVLFHVLTAAVYPSVQQHIDEHGHNHHLDIGDRFIQRHNVPELTRKVYTIPSLIAQRKALKYHYFFSLYRTDTMRPVVGAVVHIMERLGARIFVGGANPTNKLVNSLYTSRYAVVFASANFASDPKRYAQRELNSLVHRERMGNVLVDGSRDNVIIPVFVDVDPHSILPLSQRPVSFSTWDYPTVGSMIMRLVLALSDLPDIPTEVRTAARTDHTSFGRWLDEYCAENPQLTFAEAESLRSCI